jgi:para-nitrobenzyl esterase
LINRREFIKAGLSLAVLSTTSSCAKQSTATPTVKIRSGKLQGEVVDGVHRFLGIPYAEVPFGENRWRAPIHRSPWQGNFPATQYGAICPQTGTGLDFGLPDEGEDCLNVNIWTPDPASQNLPVMVWAHGGGQISGSGATQLYDGTHLAKEGFLYLEELFGDDIGPGNLGIQDMICVLEWVAENIKQFGGDPNNITLFGESGGGATTQAVIATPGSEGLLRRAILQSGGHAAQRPGTATKIATSLLKDLGVEAGNIDALRAVPFQKLAELYPNLEQLDGVGQPQIYLPVINQHMPIHPTDAPFEGRGLELDYLMGTCRDEMNLFSMFIPDLEESLFGDRAAQVIESAGITREALAESYRKGDPELEDEALANRIIGDMWFRVPSIRIAEGHASLSQANTFMYLFEWESPLIGAAHALDLMLFGNGLPVGLLGGFADYENTATTMRKAWAAFARSGDPSTVTLSWPKYDEKRLTMSLDETTKILEDPFGAQLQLLEPVIQGSWADLPL